VPIDRRLMFIQALTRASTNPTRRRRGSARCYGPPCEMADCPGKTVGNKPYCLDHVHLMPYAAKIRAREAERERELGRKHGPPLNGYVAQDLLGAIKLNQSSIPALARDLRVPHREVDILVAKMVKAKLVAIRRSKRSTYVIRLPAPGDPSPHGEHPGPAEGRPS
jgi:hypothetical protein